MVYTILEYIDGHNEQDILKQKKKSKHNITENIDIEFKPDDVTISTMTITCKLGCTLNVDNIGKYIDLNQGGIVEVIYGDIFRSLISRKQNKLKIKKKKKSFYNQVTLKINTKKDKIINVKLFKNGSIQMTGCKSVNGSIEALEKLICMLQKEKAILDPKTFKIHDKKFTDQLFEFSMSAIYDYKIAMINSNFSIGFCIDRNKLFNCLSKDNYESSFDPIIHAGVIIRHHTENKTISIFVFESGSIVITGARTCKQIYDGYNFINKYLLQNYKFIVKTNNLSNSTILKYLEGSSK